VVKHLAIALSLVALPALAEDPRVLVLDLAAVGVEASIAAQATTLVADGVAGLGGMKVMTMADLKEVADVKRTQAILGCESDAACLAEITKQAKAELVINGSVGRVGKDLVVTLALIESESATVKGRVSRPVSSAKRMPEALKVMVAMLFGSDAGAQAKFALPDGAKRSFAVLDLKTAGVTEDIAKNLTQVLSTTLKEIDGASVISRDDVYAMLEVEKEKTTLGCADDEECLAEIGGALGVEYLVVGQVGQLAGSYVVSLRLIQSTGVVVENRVTETYAGPEEQLLAAMRHAGRRLIGIEADAVGGLSLSASQEEAEVYIDGELVGSTPLKPVGKLKPGRHSVRVSRERYRDYVADVYVDPAQTSSLFVELERLPDEWYETWWFWTGVSGAAVAATAAAVTGGVLYVNHLNKPFGIGVEAGVVAR
jgi:TolB-like protein